LDEPHLADIVLHELEYFANSVTMELLSCSNHGNYLRNVFFLDCASRHGQDLDYCVNVPFFCWRVFFTNHANLVGELLFEFLVSYEKVIDEFFCD
jgi:hypothetical protein